MRPSSPAPDLLAACAAAGLPVRAEPPDGAVHAGTLLLRPDVDRCRAREVTEAGRAAAEEPRVLGLPRLAHRLHRAHRGDDDWRTPLPPWGMRLSRLARAVRRVLGDVDAELAWADDGRTCWLLAVRPAGRVDP